MQRHDLNRVHRQLIVDCKKRVFTGIFIDWTMAISPKAALHCLRFYGLCESSAFGKICWDTELNNGYRTIGMSIILKPLSLREFDRG